MKKKVSAVRKGVAAVLALGFLIPSMTPAAAAGDTHVTIESVKFNGMKAPSEIKDMASTYTGASVQV